MRNAVSRFLFLALLLFAMPVTAQERDLWQEYDGPRRIEFSASGGLFLSTAWSDQVFLESFSGLGVTNRQLLSRGLSMAPDFGWMGAFTYWKGRYGFRVRAGYVHSCATTGNRCDEVVSHTVDALAIIDVDMNQFIYGVQGIVGLTEYSRKQWFRPYVLLGFGGVTYDLDQPLSALVPGPLITTGPVRIDHSDRIIAVANPTTLVFSSSEVGVTSKLALNLGVGTDLRIPAGSGAVGLRLDASDQISQSPQSLRVTQFGGGSFTPWGCTSQCDGIQEVDFNGRAVHNWQLSAAIFFEFGVKGYKAKE